MIKLGSEMSLSAIGIEKPSRRRPPKVTPWYIGISVSCLSIAHMSVQTRMRSGLSDGDRKAGFCQLVFIKSSACLLLTSKYQLHRESWRQ